MLYEVDCYYDSNCGTGYKCDKSGAFTEWKCVSKTTTTPECTSTFDCNDNNGCTLDKCENGKCTTHADAGLCDDKNASTLNICSSTGAYDWKCDYPRIVTPTCPTSCDDNNACTTDSCVNGKCVNTAINCNDNNVCTTDKCITSSAGAACSNTQIVGCCNSDSDCDDNNACTTDTCSNGNCNYVPITGCFVPECEKDSDCGLYSNCDSNIKKIISPLCSNQLCTTKETVVECCLDINCASGYYCNEDNVCEKTIINKDDCPFECCTNEELYIDKTCTSTKPYCVNYKCVADETNIPDDTGTDTGIDYPIPGLGEDKTFMYIMIGLGIIVLISVIYIVFKGKKRGKIRRRR
jgi:hypothetical protein